MAVLNAVENQKGKNYHFIAAVDYHNHVLVNTAGVLILDITHMYVLIHRQDRGGFVILLASYLSPSHTKSGICVQIARQVVLILKSLYGVV